MSICKYNPKFDYSKEVTIFTDGSALKNTQNSPAGWGVYIPLLKKSFSKGLIGSNNVAELTAIRVALFYYRNFYDKVFKQFGKSELYMISDSEYSIKAVCGVNKVKANAENIVESKKHLEYIKTKLGIDVKFIHVNSHTGGKDFMSVNNDIVDTLARERAKEMTKSKNNNEELSFIESVNDKFGDGQLFINEQQIFVNNDKHKQPVVVDNSEYITASDYSPTGKLTAGSLSDILTKCIELRWPPGDEYIKVIKSNVRNAILAYKKDNNIKVSDDEINFIGQGYRNIVVSFPNRDHLIRISKFVKPYYSQKYIHIMKLFKDYPDNGFAGPLVLRFSNDPPIYLYQHIKPLLEIGDQFDDKLVTECMRKTLTFISIPENDMTFYDFKYDNLMFDPDSKEYLNCDYDLQPKTHLLTCMQNEYRTIPKITYFIDNYSPNDLKAFIGQEFNFFQNHEFIIKIMLSYLARTEDGKLDLTRFRNNNYDPMLMTTMIHARLFIVKTKFDTRPYFKGWDMTVLVNEQIIKAMISMESTKVSDVLYIENE